MVPGRQTNGKRLQIKPPTTAENNALNDVMPLAIKLARLRMRCVYQISCLYIWRGFMALVCGL
ncbi:MAG TPA: hypothetical protein DEF92_06705 [Leclercia adecarboxylata]|nr:hypothetical protein [Leclercia adecarboxylata]